MTGRCLEGGKTKEVKQECFFQTDMLAVLRTADTPRYRTTDEPAADLGNELDGEAGYRGHELLSCSRQLRNE